MKITKRQCGAACTVFFVVLVLAGFWALIGRVQLCIFRLFTGVPCPGCGLTHAALALMHGKIRESFAYHPFLIPVLFVFLTMALRKHGFFQKIYKNKIFYCVLFALMMTFYIIRMILYFPNGPYPMVYDDACLLGVMSNLF